MSLRRLMVGVGVPAMVMAMLWGPVAEAAVASVPPSVRHVVKSGIASYHPSPTGTGAFASLATEISQEAGGDGGFAAAARAGRPGVNRSLAWGRRGAADGRGQLVPSAAVAGAAARVVRAGPQLLASFDGLNHFDQRTANGGNQFSLEPPDQGLCVGHGHVVEAVNDVFRVFNADGTGQTGVQALNNFLGYPAAINRATGAFGPFVTDPSCLFDPTTGSFFLAVLTLDRLADGTYTGTNHLDLAVTTDPTGRWNIYRLDVTDDGSNGTPVHPHCPCIGDYPHLGVDGNGFYLTTNEYSFFGPEFNSAQVYAFSKRALARGAADVLVTQLDTTAADRGRSGFTLWPAQSPAADQYSTAASGTEYFLSSNAAPEANPTATTVTSTSIVTWSLTNTASLNTGTPRVHLHDTRVSVTRYSLPPPANQKYGPVPLADCLNFDPCGLNLLDAPDPFKPETETALDSNDTRMQQVTYTGGRLYGALDTAVTVDHTQKAGIAWYILRPKSTVGAVTAALVKQGQIGLAGNNLIYPAIGINSAGHGVMAFTLTGSSYYPSAAYTAFDAGAGPGPIFVAKAGLGPDDGFTGYAGLTAPGPARSRWGDYGATAVDGTDIWIASEYIGQTCTDTEYFQAPFGTCHGTRTALANWDTRISKIIP